MALDDLNHEFFDSLLLGSDNLFRGALGVAALSTTYSFASSRVTASSVVGSVAAVEFEKTHERNSTTAPRNHFDNTARGTNSSPVRRKY
jgi:hypothetical protein